MNTKKADMLFPVSENVLSSYTGEKLYEMTNHLGNVLTVINDIKVPYQSGADILYYATITNTSDYSPFGVTLDEAGGRTQSLSATENFYRYAYQGSEKDDEIKGSGNSYTTEFRQLDPRLGRWLSIDPMSSSFPWQSPYCSMDNNPVNLNDRLGLAPSNTPLNVQAAKLLSGHIDGSITYQKNGDVSVSFPVNLGGVEIMTKVTFAKTMTRSEMTSVLTNWGMNYESSYAFFLFGGDRPDTWARYGYWLDEYYLSTPPLPVEILARFAMAIPGTVYGWSTGNDWMTGTELSGLEQALGILDVIPGEALVKLGITAVVVKVGNQLLDLSRGVKFAGVYGKCQEYATDFISVFGKAIKSAGGTFTKKSFNSNISYGIFHNGKKVTDNGHHTLVELVIDGKTIVFDNLNSTGVLKSEYVKTLVVSVRQSDGTVLDYTGNAAYELFK